MKKYITLLFASMFAICTGHSTQPDKTYEVKLMYNSAIGYSWYLEDPTSLQMTELLTETKTPGAFEPTKLGHPYAQTFIFRLKNANIQSETVTFKYKHDLEKDQDHSKAAKKITLTSSDFKN
ncbi:MAG: protease inhibitor I42 family protein [Rickettsiales bacterium]|jgi:predicted secreted protein|nr:protease inhibitor I42 family protein [Rickettsiales bacterium]